VIRYSYFNACLDFQKKKKKRKSCTLVFGFAAFSSLANRCVLPASSRNTRRYWQDNCLNIWLTSLSLLNNLKK